MDLQELITRGRFVFAGAPERLKVYELVNGKRTATDIGFLTKRSVTNVCRDLRSLSDAGLIEARLNIEGEPVRIGRQGLYRKIPLARTVPVAYFKGPAKVVPRGAGVDKGRIAKGKKERKRPAPVRVPCGTELLDICNDGEDQIYEFKGQGTEPKKITREVGAMLNTRRGGLIFYGIGDDGTVQGADSSKQTFDQRVRNSVNDMISPAATIRLHSVHVLGYEIFVIAVPPWNRRDVYQVDGRVLLRKGTNVFYAKPEESRRLHGGHWVV